MAPRGYLTFVHTLRLSKILYACFAHEQQVVHFADEVWKYGSADRSMEAPMEVWKCVRKGRMGWPFSATVSDNLPSYTRVFCPS